MRKSSANGAEPTPEAAQELVSEVRSALLGARAPRKAKQLKQAAKVLEAAGNVQVAVQALNALAALELLRGNAARCLTHSRAAARLAQRMTAAPRERLEALKLQTRALVALSDWPRASKVAEEHLRSQRAVAPEDPAAGAALVARVRWAQGDLPGALEIIAEAPSAGDVPALMALEAALFVEAGCPTAAIDRLTRSLRAPELSDGAAAELLLTRGWAQASLGFSDRAARDFRRVLRAARVSGNRGEEAIAGAALGAVQIRESEDAESPRNRRAHAALARAVRLGRRLRDPRTARVLAAVNRPEAGASVPTLNGRQAARALVDLAGRTTSVAFVDACVLETKRLASLAEGQPPYAALELAREAVGATILAP